jgi:hypothetical protein
MPLHNGDVMKTILRMAPLLLLICLPVQGQQAKKGQAQDSLDPYYKHIKALATPNRIELLAVGFIPMEKLRGLDCKDPKYLCNPPDGLPVRILATTVLVGKAAEKIAALWRQLEPGNSMGCFAPGYIMRFYTQDQLLLETEVCFHCCNASLPNYGLVGICGSDKAFASFQKKVMEVLPYPRIKIESK